MRAAVLRGPRDIRVEMVDTPPIREDEVLVKVMACGICGTDLHAYKKGGGAGGAGRLILGHEFSGEAARIGAAIEGVKEGDRVVGTGYRGCGACYRCRQGDAARCPRPLVPGEGLDGAFAEYVVVPRPMVGRTFFRIPDGMGWEEAATMEPLAVACHAAARGRIQKGQTVAVIGAGMIGQCIAQVVRSMGARTIVSEPSPLRLAVAGRLGAEITINPGGTDPVSAVTAATSGDMADAVFECSGSPAGFRQAVDMVRPFGTMVQVGLFEKGLEIPADLASMIFAFKNLTLRGSGGQRWEMALELAGSGRVKTGGLVTQVFPLDRIRDGFESQLDPGSSIKGLITP